MLRNILILSIARGGLNVSLTNAQFESEFVKYQQDIALKEHDEKKCSRHVDVFGVRLLAFLVKINGF